MSDIQLELEQLTQQYLTAVYELQEQCSDEVYDQLDQFTSKINEMLTDIEY